MYSVHRLNAYKEKQTPQKPKKKNINKQKTQTKTKNKQECKMFENFYLFITFFKTQCHNTYLYIFKNVYMCFIV